ncbi:MAG: CocE/NonD family hydrolase [Nocardioides sp.]|nr:CocE/NonD family hydrolase [Nocardioides sp.]
MSSRLRAVATAAALSVTLVGLTPATAPAAPSPGTLTASATAAQTATVARRGTWRPRGEQWSATVRRTDIPIRMSDGTVLRGDLVLPARADGTAVRRRLPVIVTITAYNKSASGGSPLAGATGDYLVKRGYAQLTVDARGTGGSQGVWGAFSAREGRDAAEVVEWAHRAPWSNGRVGMSGASYLGITQVFAAAHRPKGLRAIFPQVPAADVYRDVVASGGQIDVGFIPLWLGLVTGAGLVPPAYGVQEPEAGLGALVDRLTSATTFTAPLLAGAVLGQEPAYDGPFYRERSPIRVVDRVRVPTFLIGGQRDLFQRGTPMLFERLQRNGVPTKMIIGPWDHLQGSSGAEVGDAGYGSLAELQLRWFDRWVRGRKDAALNRDIAPYTYFEEGSGRWIRNRRWIRRDQVARTFRLSGVARPGAPAGLVPGTPQAGSSVVPAVPVSGVCTRSANQWTAGIMNAVWPENPCLADNRANDFTGVVFETAPLGRRLRFQGPMAARIHTSTPSGDGMLSVMVEDVAPDGTVTRLTGGWQVISHRALDGARSRRLDGKVIQPWHPFTKAAQRTLPAGEVAPIDVEIFPTGAVVRKGHRLRLAIQAFDVPHLLPPLPGLVPSLAPLTIHSSPARPSTLTLPGLAR